MSLTCRHGDVEPDTLAVLEHIGLLRVYVGIETTSEQGLQTLGRAVTRSTIAGLQLTDCARIPPPHDGGGMLTCQ